MNYVDMCHIVKQCEFSAKSPTSPFPCLPCLCSAFLHTCRAVKRAHFSSRTEVECTCKQQRHFFNVLAHVSWWGCRKTQLFQRMARTCWQKTRPELVSNILSSGQYKNKALVSRYKTAHSATGKVSLHQCICVTQ